MASNEYSAVVQLLAKQIVEACKGITNENNRTYLPTTLSHTEISADMISGDIGTSKIREFDAVVARVAQAKIDSAEIDAAQIVNLKVTDADIVNLDAGKITSGQIDTKLVKLFAGDDLSFVWNADGIYAYEIVNGEVNPQSFARFNKDGILVKKNGRTIIEQSWEGFYLGSIDGSVELNAEDGFVVYDRPRGDGADTRNPLIKIGKRMNGDKAEYGIQFYQTVNGVTKPTLSSDNSGNLWLDGALTVGDINNEGTIVIDGRTKSIGTVRYASGALGNGWQIDGNGNATFNNIHARGTISASVFEYDKISSVGGSLYVAPTLISTEESPISVVTIDGARYYEIRLKHGFSGENFESAGMSWGVNDILSVQGFAVNGDKVYEMVDLRFTVTSIDHDGVTMRSNSYVGGVVVENSETGEKYAPGVIKLEGYSVAKDASFIYLGTNDNGTLLRRGIYITASDRESPYIDVYDSQRGDNNPKVRLGKLTGIRDSRIMNGEALDGYGLYAQDAYLTGTIVANKGNIAGWEINDNTLETEGGTVGLADGSADSRVGDYVIWAGNVEPDAAPFSVKKDGTIKASLLDLSDNVVVKDSVENAIDTIVSEGFDIGTQNYVQPTRPTEYRVGDTWQDSANKYKLYVAKGDTGHPEIDWVPVSIGQISGSVLTTDADTGTMVIGSGKSLSINANGVIELLGNNAVHIGSGGTISMVGSKLHINAGDLIIEGGKSIDVALSESIDKAISKSNRVYIQFDEPKDPDLKIGDLWVNDGDTVWDELSGKTWEELGDYAWEAMNTGESVTHVWNGKTWVLIVDMKEVKSHGTRLDMTEEHIKLLAYKEEVNAVAERLTAAEFKIEPDRIISTVIESNKYKDGVEELHGLVEKVSSAVQDITPEHIISTVTNSKTYQDDISNIDDKINETNSAVQKITPEHIVNTVTKSETYTALDDRVSANANGIQTANQNIANANSSITALTSRVSTAEQSITADAIMNKVTSTETYKTLSGKVNTNSTGIANVNNRVDSTNESITALTSRVKTAEQSITADAIMSKVTSTETYKTLSNQVTANKNGLATANTNLSSLTTRVSTAEQNITADSIMSKVASTQTYKTLSNQVAANKSGLSTANDNISSLTTRVKSAEQKITDEAIISTVSATYSTKTQAQGYANAAKDAAIADTTNKLKDYSTTSQMNSAINQKADSITSTVSTTYSTKTQAQGYATTAKNDAIADTTNKLKNYSTTSQMNSAIEQKANSITLEVQRVEGIANQTPTKVENSSVVINTSGVSIKTGGTFTVDSKKFDINASGEMSATNAMISGKLQVDGKDVWHKGSLVVSTVTPPSPTNGMIWVKPDTSSIPATGMWTHEALTSRPWKSTYDYPLTGVSIGAAPGNATYTYEVSLPLYHSSSNTNPYSCTVYLGASSGAKTINLGTQNITKKESGVYTFTTTSTVWLGNSNTIYMHIEIPSNGWLTVDSYNGFSCTLTAKSNSGGTGWKNCAVQMYVV